MTRNELMAMIEAAQEEYGYVGIRYENMAREIGDTCNNSRHNPDRDDEREFPVYGSAEYNEMPELDGASAWNVGSYACKAIIDDLANGEYSDCDHCYVVASDNARTHDDADDGEIVLEDAVVVGIVF